MSQQIDFSWRYQPNLRSKDAVLLKYLQDCELYSNLTKTKLMLNALNACYYPLAYQAIKGKHNPKMLEKIALESILGLVTNIHAICVECGVSEIMVKNLLMVYFGENNQILTEKTTQSPTKEEEVKQIDLDLSSFGNFMFDKEIS